MKTVTLDIASDLPDMEAHAYAESLCRAIGPAIRSFVTTHPAKAEVTIAILCPKLPPPAIEAAHAYESKLPSLLPPK